MLCSILYFALNYTIFYTLPCDTLRISMSSVFYSIPVTSLNHTHPNTVADSCHRTPGRPAENSWTCSARTPWTTDSSCWCPGGVWNSSRRTAPRTSSGFWWRGRPQPSPPARPPRPSGPPTRRWGGEGRRWDWGAAWVHAMGTEEAEKGGRLRLLFLGCVRL